MNVLPPPKLASPVPLLIRSDGWDDGSNPMLDSSADLEVEARNLRAPELDAEAPGPQVVEAETVENILEMYSQGPVGELEGQSKYATEI